LDWPFSFYFIVNQFDMYVVPTRAPVLASCRKMKVMLTIILVLAGLVCFALFFKAIDLFDKI